MKITVKLFARFKEAAGTGSLSIDMPAGSTLANLLDSLRAQVAGLPLVAGQTILSVNQEFATPETVLHPGDEVAIFPPVSGGGNDAGKFVVTTNPITLDAVARMVTYPHTGAVATFAGVVRNISGDKLVTSLNYEAYHDMAVAKMKQVAQEARRRWPAIADIAIVQRIGHLEVGELAVAIAVSSGHRNDGCFEACQYSINRLKQIVPIWKKELGPGGEEWIEGDYNPSMQ
ncbi:MAG: molybdenum cofactor biosynthesis protein MoaE [Anaerolineae bacterium]